MKARAAQSTQRPRSAPLGQAGLFSDSEREPLSSARQAAGGVLGLPEPLLNAHEAAHLLNVPRSTVYELVRSRALPHVRVGDRGLRFARGDLAAWVAENTFGRR
ncbi:MAG: helix-turn-helix domain-containing protein [Solirubrobacterales bacterium]